MSGVGPGWYPGGYPGAQPQQPQHQPPAQPAPPPQAPHPPTAIVNGAAWQQGAGGGYWTGTAGSTAYYAEAPVSSAGGGSESGDSSDESGGGDGSGRLRKFRKTMHHQHPHPHAHQPHHMVVPAAAMAAATARETSELERRLKKNMREQKRANKINDQIAIMKSILEEVGLRPPATKSSILSEGIALVRHLVALTDPDKVAALRAKASGGMLAPGASGGEGGSGQGEDAGALMETGSTDAGAGLPEPYVLLFRKSATPLAMAEPDGAHRFLDCNLRFAEVFAIAPQDLQQTTLYTFTREGDYDNTRRVLTLVSQPGLLVDETTPLEVVLTNLHGHRFLVRVSALTDDAGKPCYLLFTPKAVLRGTGEGEPGATAAHVAQQQQPQAAPAVVKTEVSRAPAAASSAASSATNSPALGLAHVNGQGAGAAHAGATSSESSSIGSANSSSNSLYHGAPHGAPNGAPALAGTTQAAMAAARTLLPHMKPMI